MNWSAISAISDTLAAIGVIASIAYLAIQVKSNTASMQLAARQSVANEFKASARLMAEHSKQLIVGMNDYPNVAFNIRNDFSCVLTDIAMSFQSCQAAYQAGSLPIDIYDSYLHFTASLLGSNPDGQRYWSEFKSVYIPIMVDALDHRIAQGGLADIRQLPQYNFEWDHQNDLRTPN